MSFGAIGGGGGSGGGGGGAGLVADAINDGTTTVAPSQNAVFDALAGKVPTSRTVAGLDLSADRTAAALLAAQSGQAGAAFSFAGQRVTSLAPATTVGDAEQYGQDGLRSLVYGAPSNMRKFKKALSKTRYSSGRTHVAVVGDSIPQGTGGDTPFFTKAWPAQVAALFDTAYGASNDTGVIPTNLMTTTWGADASENRFTTVGTWSLSNGLGGSGGFFGLSRAVTGATNTLLFSPPASCDRFRIYYQNQSSFGGTFSYSIDSGAQTGTQAANGTTGLQVLDIVVSAGAGVHTLLLTPPGSSKYFYIVGVEAMLGTTGGVKVSRIAKNGGTSGQASSADSLAALAQIAPDLTILALGTNDFAAQTALATYNTNLTALVTNAKTTGDVLIISWPTQSASGTIPQASYLAEAKAVAAAQAVPFFDLQDRWGTYSQANTSPTYMADGTHPNALGHNDIAHAVFDIVQRLAA